MCTGETITSSLWARVGDFSRSGDRVSQLTISAILGGVGKSCLTGKVRHPLDGPCPDHLASTIRPECLDREL